MIDDLFAQNAQALWKLFTISLTFYYQLSIEFH